MKRTPRIMAVLATVATLFLAACGDEYVDGDGDVTTETTAPDADDNGTEDGGDDHEMGTADSPWPLIDAQPLPTGVVEGGQLVGQFRNLGAVEVPWTTDKAAQQVIGRTVLEPLFATSLAQEFGSKSAAQVAFWGLDGLWEDEKWTEHGNEFLKLLEAEIRDRFLGFGDLPSGKVWVVLANAERDAVRMTFESDELKDVGRLVVFKTECGEVAVDVKGNLYVPCDCGRFKIETPPPSPPSTTTPTVTTPNPTTTVPGTVPPTTPPTTDVPPPSTDVPPTTEDGKDHTAAPSTTMVVVCEENWHMSRETGRCVRDQQETDPVEDSGDAGVGAPGAGDPPTTSDPAPDPVVVDSSVPAGGGEPSGR